METFYVNRRECVRVKNSVSIVSCLSRAAAGMCDVALLFNVYMDGVVREVNARMLGRGLILVYADGREWNLNQLLFADDTALVADLKGKLRQLVEESGRVCKKEEIESN